VLRGERFQRERQRLLSAAEGVVLEIGFGTGLNLLHYPRKVRALYAADPSSMLQDRVADRVAQAPFPVHIQQAQAERLPFTEATFDCAVSTFTLCTIQNPIMALREVRRILKPEGHFLFLEHGLSDDPDIARWQDRLNPLQNWLGCGCNLNRRIDVLVRAADLHLESLDRYVLQGSPRIGGEIYRGIAIPRIGNLLPSPMHHTPSGKIT
jgi:SAM-dependent methyltransferase